MTPIRLLLADDQSLVRGAMAALLDLEPDLEVVAEVGRGDEVVDGGPRAPVDVALLDVEMPGLDGVAATAGAACRGAGLQGADRDDVRAAGLPAQGDGGRSVRLRGQGHAGSSARRRRTPGACRAARRRPAAGRRVADPGRLTADRARDRGAAGGRRRRHGAATSPGGCTCRRAPSATTCPAPSARPEPALAPRRSASPPTTAGSSASPSRLVRISPPSPDRARF